MKQVAINDIGTAEDFMAAIDQSMQTVKTGSMVTGTVVQIDREGVLVDFGYKCEGLIPIYELAPNKNIDPNDIVKIGDVVSALVLRNQDENGQCILSIKDGEAQKIWDSLQSMYEISQPIKGRIKKSIKGGLIVDIGVKAFLPGSQVEINKVDDYTGYIGQEFDFLIIEFKKDKKNIVLSRRALLEKTIKEDRLIEFAKIAVGQIYTGRVSGVAEYGAFVEIGSLAGLIHVSKMNNKTLTVDQEVEVEVISIDLEKSRFSLALKG